MTGRRLIPEEHDVVRLLEGVGRWPAGTQGTIVSVHNPDFMVVEMPGEADCCLDLLVDVPTELLQVTFLQGVTAVA